MMKTIASFLVIATALLALTAAGSIVGGRDDRPLSESEGGARRCAVIPNPTVRTPTLVCQSAADEHHPSPPSSLAAQSIVNITVDTDMNATGWMKLAIDRSSDAPAANESDVYFAAGYAEGYSFASRISAHYGNTARMLLIVFPEAGHEWVRENLAWMTSNAVAHGDTDSYWRMVRNHLEQLRGLSAGYRDAFVAAPPGSMRNLTFEDIYYINLVFEMPDIQTAVGGGLHDHQPGDRRPRVKVGGCSALIRVTGSDFFAAHATWSDYAVMLRVEKQLRFPEALGYPAVLFSSYPATIHSGDDWYATSNKLFVIETTNDNHNISAARDFTPTASVAEFIRIMVAIAATGSNASTPSTPGETFVQTYSKFNSGTYNNQWMVVDGARFTPAASSSSSSSPTLGDGFLWILEQMPGVIVAADETQTVRDQGYWASFNIPFFPYIFNVSGTRAKEDEYGTYYSYTKYARPEIFRRNVTDPANPVDSMERMQQIMRYNDWRVDPLSAVPCKSGTAEPVSSPWLAIASRGDLAPASIPQCCTPSLESQMAQNAFGAVDAKIGGWRSSKAEAPGVWNPAAQFINGPTAEQQPVFNWSAFHSFFALTPHEQQPDVFDFGWLPVRLWD